MSPQHSYSVLVDESPSKDETEKRLTLFFDSKKGWRVRVTQGVFTRGDEMKINRVLKVALREHRAVERVKTLNKRKNENAS